MKKSQKGFTLVELIVVIAIIGVLAAILVPSMMGYVKKSRLKTANSNAKLVFQTAANVAAEKETAGTPLSSSDDLAGVDFGSMTAAPSGSDVQVAIYNALKDNGKGAGVVWLTFGGDGNPTMSHWTKTTTDKMVGQYPNPTDDVSKAEGATAGTPYTP